MAPSPVLAPPLGWGGVIMEPSGLLSYGDLVIDLDAWEVRLRGNVVDLTKTEFEILAALASRPRRVVAEDELTRLIWGDSWFGDDGNLAVHISKLRAKLGESGANPGYLRTVRGVGYRFDPRVELVVEGVSETYQRLRQRSDSVEAMVTLDLVIVEVDTQLPDVLGRPPGELVGRVVPFISDEALRDPEVARQLVESLVSRGVTSWSGTRSLPHADGHVVSAEFATHVTVGPDGEVTGLRFVFVVLDDDDSGTGVG